MTRALVFACPRDIGANSLRLEFREGTSSEASDAPITHSRNVLLYRYRAVERKAYRWISLVDVYRVAGGLTFPADCCNAASRA